MQCISVDSKTVGVVMGSVYNEYTGVPKCMLFLVLTFSCDVELCNVSMQKGGGGDLALFNNIT